MSNSNNMAHSFNQFLNNFAKKAENKPGTVENNNIGDTKNYALCAKNVPSIMKEKEFADLVTQYGEIYCSNKGANSPYWFITCKSQSDMESIMKGMEGNGYGIQLSIKTGKKNEIRSTNKTRKNEMPIHQYSREHDRRNHSRNSDLKAGLLTNEPNNLVETSDSKKSDYEKLSVELESMLKGVCELCGSVCSSYCERCHTYYCSVQCQTKHYLDHKFFCHEMSSLVVPKNNEKSENDSAVELDSMLKGACELCGLLCSNYCGRCHRYYCSVHCQTKHWPHHKLHCFKMSSLVVPKNLSSDKPNSMPSESHNSNSFKTTQYNLKNNEKSGNDSDHNKINQNNRDRNNRQIENQNYRQNENINNRQHENQNNRQLENQNNRQHENQNNRQHENQNNRQRENKNNQNKSENQNNRPNENQNNRQRENRNNRNESENQNYRHLENQNNRQKENQKNRNETENQKKNQNNFQRENQKNLKENDNSRDGNKRYQNKNQTNSNEKCENSNPNKSENKLLAQVNHNNNKQIEKLDSEGSNINDQKICSKINFPKPTPRADPPPSFSKVIMVFAYCSDTFTVRSADLKDSEDYTNNLNLINKSSKVAKTLSSLPKLHSYCITEYDGVYCRATVTKVISEIEIYVMYVDFGNAEVRKLSELKELLPELHELTRYPFEVRLRSLENLTTIGNEQFKMLTTELIDNSVQMKLIYDDNNKNGYVISNAALIKVQTNESINNKMLNILSFNIPNNDDDPIMSSDITYKEIEIYSNMKLIVLDVQLIEEGTLVCIPEDLYQHVRLFEDQLKKYATSCTKAICPRPKEMCVAEYKGVWRRAVCYEVEGDGNPTLEFIDYGDFCDIDVTKIRKYPKNSFFPCWTHMYTITEVQTMINSITDSKKRESTVNLLKEIITPIITPSEISKKDANFLHYLIKLPHVVDQIRKAIN